MLLEKRKIAHQQRVAAAIAAKSIKVGAEPVANASDNVVWLPNSTGVPPDNILKGGAIPYRFTNYGVLVLWKQPSELPQGDILAINNLLDSKEGEGNKAVKKVIAGALTQVFGDQRIKLFEIGPGTFPIAPYFNKSSLDIEYHGIDCDPACIKSLHRQGYDASHCDTIPAVKHQDGVPSIVTSVYALQFVIDDQLPDRMGHLLTDDGIFVGNLYLDNNERQLRKKVSPESARSRL